jgi:hypothetical protein
MGGEKAFLGSKSLCVEKNSKVSTNSSLKISYTNHDHSITLSAFKYVIPLLIVVTFGATILIDISVKNRREKTIVDEKWKLAYFHQWILMPVK